MIFTFSSCSLIRGLLFNIFSTKYTKYSVLIKNYLQYIEYTN
nr:MAG TPA: hypothetical protein [Caudoviricetes sp.]